MARAPTPSTTPSSLQDGLDSMWRFQLRKENAVLLEAQETQQRVLQALAAEATNAKKDFEERYSALEAQISNLAHDEKRDRQTFETWREEVATLKSQMGVVMEKQERKISEAEVAAPTMESPSPRLSTADSTHVTLSSSVPAATTNTMPSMHQVISMKAFDQTSSAQSRQIPDTFPNATKRNDNRAFDVTVSMTRVRSRSRRGSPPHKPASAFAAQYQALTTPPQPKSKAGVKVAPLSTASSSQNVKIPRVHQGTRSLKAYYKSASNIWTSLPNSKDQKVEIEFIALFVKGMRDADKRDILVSELQQKHQSRTKKDGKVEILCKWDDVSEAINDTELIDMAAGPKEKHHK